MTTAGTGPEPEGTRELPVQETAGAPDAPADAEAPLDRRQVDRWSGPRADARPQRASFIGMAGMAMTAFLILASGAVIPWWGIALLALVWVAALVQGTRWFMVHPGRVVALAVGMLVLWLAVLMGGALLLDWGR